MVYQVKFGNKTAHINQLDGCVDLVRHIFLLLTLGRGSLLHRSLQPCTWLETCAWACMRDRSSMQRVRSGFCASGRRTCCVRVRVTSFAAAALNAALACCTRSRACLETAFCSKCSWHKQSRRVPVWALIALHPSSKEFLNFGAISSV